MLDTNTVETNMEHFKDRNRAAGPAKLLSGFIFLPQWLVARVQSPNLQVARET